MVPAQESLFGYAPLPVVKPAKSIQEDCPEKVFSSKKNHQVKFQTEGKI
jgi:hypothetical protein